MNISSGWSGIHRYRHCFADFEIFFFFGQGMLTQTEFLHLTADLAVIGILAEAITTLR